MVGVARGVAFAAFLFFLSAAVAGLFNDRPPASAAPAPRDAAAASLRGAVACLACPACTATDAAPAVDAELLAPVRAASPTVAGAAVPTPGCDPLSPTFHATALAVGASIGKVTDKVTSHHYHTAYQAHVGPRRCTATSFFEVGLGCDQGYGAGASAPLWAAYMPRAHIATFEYDAACATAWARDAVPALEAGHGAGRFSIASGDQSDPAVLRAAAIPHAPFDVVVDDGGHSMKQQLVTLNVLLPLVRPGGVYVLEDLGSSFPERSAPHYRADKGDVKGFTTYKCGWPRDLSGSRELPLTPRSRLHAGTSRP